MFSPIKTMFMYFPLRAWSTVLILFLISRYTYRKTREKWETDRLTKTQSYAQWLLVSYILLLLFLTVLGRRSMDYYRYNFDIGYSYRDAYHNGNPQAISTIAVNIAMFVPVGFLGTIGFKRFGILKAFLLGILLTVSIEFLQLMLRNGTCEIDDLISNTGGLVLGILLSAFFRPLSYIIRRYYPKRPVAPKDTLQIAEDKEYLEVVYYQIERIE